jgi:hypothetical protein
VWLFATTTLYYQCIQLTSFPVSLIESHSAKIEQVPWIFLFGFFPLVQRQPDDLRPLIENAGIFATIFALTWLTPLLGEVRCLGLPERACDASVWSLVSGSVPKISQVRLYFASTSASWRASERRNPTGRERLARSPCSHFKNQSCYCVASVWA